MAGISPGATEISITDMTLEQKITNDIATAMKAKDQGRLSTLRMLKAALMNKGVEKNRVLEPAEELQVVSSLVKQRRDAIEQFTAGGRTDLADKERAEITILETYLPPAVTSEELDRAIAQAIAETGAATAKDMGKVMKAVMALLAGKTVDGKAVSEAVRARLA
jgi:uncharacterized protein YqeY